MMQKKKWNRFTQQQIWKICYAANFILGLVLIVAEVHLYRKTLIAVYVPITIIVIVGILAYFANRRHYKLTYALQGNFFPFMQNLISWGFISGYLFMAVNFYFAGRQLTTHHTAIIERSTLTGPKRHRNKGNPLVVIEYHHFEKDLIFLQADTQRVNQADSVLLNIKHGALGFDVLANYDVY